MLGLATGITNTSYQWQPNMVDADLKLWLRNGVGVNVAQWDDSSGNNNHALQGSSPNQATVSGGGLRLDGSNDHYDFTSSITISAQEAFMVFAVVYPENDSDDTIDKKTIISDEGAADFIEFFTNKKIRLRFNNGTAISPTFGDVQFPSNEKYLVGIKRDGGAEGNVHIYKNGDLLEPSSQLADTSQTKFENISIRNNDRFFHGWIYEMLVYDTTDLSASNITKISNYLKNKHGL
tara:strand:+ start:508 stop:1212 length:705 start_codon:yes stop_codon:yes gene_type:complete